MTNDEFWEIIAISRRSLHEEEDWENAARQRMALKQALRAVPAESVLEFYNKFYAFRARMCAWDLAGASYLIALGGDDGFMDFREAVIAQGRQVYEAALLDADSLADVATIRNYPLFMEPCGRVAHDVYQEKTGIDVDFAPIGLTAEAIDPDEPTGENWQDNDEQVREENLAHRLPRLYAIFGGEAGDRRFDSLPEIRNDGDATKSADAPP